MSTLIFGGGEIARSLPGRIIPHSECDVRDVDMIEVVFEAYMPETVIFTAGVSYPAALGEDTRYMEELETNLLGAFNVAHAAAYYGAQTMIFVGSVAGLYGKPCQAGYSASKAGLRALVQSLAGEGHNAYCVSPGRVDTAFRTRLYPDEDPATRLSVSQVTDVIENILNGAYTPGDNIVIRRKGEWTIVEVDSGQPWKEALCL